VSPEEIVFYPLLADRPITVPGVNPGQPLADQLLVDHGVIKLGETDIPLAASNRHGESDGGLCLRCTECRYPVCPLAKGD
jgi:hypothetical protein